MSSGFWRQPDVELHRELESSRRHWLTEGEEGAPFVAPGADLRGLDLGERALGSAQLQGADLRGVRLDNAILARGEFDGARLEGAQMFGVEASRASFVRAALEDVSAPRSRWVGAVLTETRMRNIELTDAVMREAEFVAADLTSAVLRRADLRGALLADARLTGADFSEADLERAVMGPQGLEGTIGAGPVAGEFATVEPRTRRDSDGPHSQSDAEFQEQVADVLGTYEGARVNRLARDGQPTFVVVLPKQRYIAVEATARPEPERLVTLELRADVLVIPDWISPPEVPTPVVRQGHLAYWLKREAPNVSPARGATAIAVRQASRLRPYIAFARQHRIDPSFLSRVSVWVDEREPLMLTSADRPLVELLPAHLDGAGLARGVRWTDARLDELTEYERAVRRLWRSTIRDPDATVELAERGQRLERELAAEVGRGWPKSRAE